MHLVYIGKRSKNKKNKPQYHNRNGKMITRAIGEEKKELPKPSHIYKDKVDKKKYFKSMYSSVCKICGHRYTKGTYIGKYFNSYAEKSCIEKTL